MSLNYLKRIINIINLYIYSECSIKLNKIEEHLHKELSEIKKEVSSNNTKTE